MRAFPDGKTVVVADWGSVTAPWRSTHENDVSWARYDVNVVEMGGVNAHRLQYDVFTASPYHPLRKLTRRQCVTRMSQTGLVGVGTL